jgi:hypothetical protein
VKVTTRRVVFPGKENAQAAYRMVWDMIDSQQDREKKMSVNVLVDDEAAMERQRTCSYLLTPRQVNAEKVTIFVEESW